MQMSYLKGKNILELIIELPNFNWTLRNTACDLVDTKLKTLIFVYYGKPKDDLFYHLDVSNGISSNDLYFIEKKERRNVGLISKVELGEPFSEYEHKFAHIPMIDFDIGEELSFMEREECIDLIKKNIREMTEIDKGAILLSGPKRNYHFIGTGYLLSEEDFVTFNGLCLLMKYTTKDGKNISIADSRHIGHALTPMKYMVEINNIDNKDKWPRYDFREKFTTLRITPKPGYYDYPHVIDIL